MSRLMLAYAGEGRTIAGELPDALECFELPAMAPMTISAMIATAIRRMALLMTAHGVQRD